MTIARRLAEFLTETRFADLPAQSAEHAAMLVASTLASAALGRNIESAAIVRTLARDRGGRADAPLWFDASPKIAAADAAQANAVMSDAAASDDSDLRAIVHCGTPLVATSLALAERDEAGGETVLAAIVLGYEAAGRICDAVSPGFRNRGFHGCLVAIFAAAVAAGRVLRLDAMQMSRTIALSATSIGGLAAAANTSVAREYHAGLAVRLGIDAALAAQRGFAAEEAILEAPRGFFEVYGGRNGAEAGEIALAGLGGSWDIDTDMAVKLVPGGHPYHALAEAAAKAARDGNVRAEEVDRIIISRPRMSVLGEPVHPTDLIGMAHSPAYFTAAGVADRGFSWEHAGPAKIADPAIHRLIATIEVAPPPSNFRQPYRQGASITIRTTDGRSVTAAVYAPKGSACLGIDWADIDAKYRALMPNSGLSDQRIDDSLAVIHRFRGLGAMADLTGLLQTGTA